MERIESRLYNKGKVHYFAMCTLDCDGEGTTHCKPHPFDEDECGCVCCSVSEHPGCSIVTMDGDFVITRRSI
jgi:hypothetical protein